MSANRSVFFLSLVLFFKYFFSFSFLSIWICVTYHGDHMWNKDYYYYYHLNKQGAIQIKDKSRSKRGILLTNEHIIDRIAYLRIQSAGNLILREAQIRQQYRSGCERNDGGASLVVSGMTEVRHWLWARWRRCVAGCERDDGGASLAAVKFFEKFKIDQDDYRGGDLNQLSTVTKAEHMSGNQMMENFKWALQGAARNTHRVVLMSAE